MSTEIRNEQAQNRYTITLDDDLSGLRGGSSRRRLG